VAGRIPQEVMLRALTRLLDTAGSDVERERLTRIFVAPEGPFDGHCSLGVALAAGWEIGGRLYARPGLGATVDSAIRRVLGLAHEDADYPAEVEAEVDRIRDCLHATCPVLRRLAVDGVPGSGKSTLARLLAERLQLRVTTLDHQDMDEALDLGADMTIFEHHRLLRTQNVDHMDAILYIDEPIELSKAKVLRRRRGGYLLEIMDYDLLKRIGQAAFAAASGRELDVPQSYVRIKLPAAGGFHIYENVQRRLKNLGLSTQGLSQEAALFLATTKRARKGFLAYSHGSGLAPEILAGLEAAVRHARRKR
jgi:hypothetical protein